MAQFIAKRIVLVAGATGKQVSKDSARIEGSLSSHENRFVRKCVCHSEIYVINVCEFTPQSQLSLHGS